LNQVLIHKYNDYTLVDGQFKAWFNVGNDITLLPEYQTKINEYGSKQVLLTATNNPDNSIPPTCPWPLGEYWVFYPHANNLEYVWACGGIGNDLTNEGRPTIFRAPKEINVNYPNGRYLHWNSELDVWDKPERV
jgi:hypothetical protein